MGHVTFAGAMSHTSAIFRQRDLLTPDQDRTVYGAIDVLRSDLEAARPDALVVFSSDHYSAFFLKNMPPFCVGVGATNRTLGDGGVPVRMIPGAPEIARELVKHLHDDGVDVAVSAEMSLDHGFACPLQFLLPDLDIPVIPVMINAGGLAMPSLARSHRLGQAIAAAARDMSGVTLGVLATGGLSHWVPRPSHEHAPASDDERIYLEHMVTGAGNPEKIRRIMYGAIQAVVDADKAMINETFDHEFIELLEQGRASAADRWSGDDVEKEAGNGGQEIRTWLAAAGAASDRPAELLAYEPVRPWLTGIGVMRWPE